MLQSATPHRDLDASQALVRSAVLDAPGVVVASGAPGTGKSTLALTTVADFIEAGAPAASALLLAPTRLQASRLAESMNGTVTATRTQPLVRTPSALAFAILRHVATLNDQPTPRLLTGPEQDAVLRDLLEGHATGSVPGPHWPVEVVPALGTVALRSQLRDLLMRAVEHGVDPPTLRQLAGEHHRPQWHAAAQVLEEYEQVTALSAPGAFDPAYIGVAAADALANYPELSSALTADLRLLVIDDAQELTASAAWLIRSLYRPDMHIMLLGDGDALTEGFRGAQADRFITLARQLGQPTFFDLQTNHRQSPDLADVATAVVNRVGVSSGVSHRRPMPTPTAGKGQVEIAVLPTPAQEAELVAHRLRRAHLIDGVPWSQMAIVARSGAQHERFRRALNMTGVPVRTGLSGVPLAADPATAHLLLAYQDVLDWCAGRLEELSGEHVVELLTSPLGQADPVALRRLRRAVRRAAPRGEDVRTPIAAAQQIDAQMGQWVLDPTWALDAPTDPDLAPLARLARIFLAGRQCLLNNADERRTPATAHALLWALWDASALAGLWERAALAGGAAGARADRNLDAVMVLFDAAQDYTQRLGRRDPQGFATHVGDQEVAADTLAPRSARAQEVHVLTPHGASGREWDIVAVVGVQDGLWPNTRLRGSLLGAEALVDVLRGRAIAGTEGLRSAQAEVISDELRQFYVALTRARRSLIVSAVASIEDQPSVFLDVIDPGGTRRTQPDVPARMTLRGLVADLRRDLLIAHQRGEVNERDRCAEMLSELAQAGVAGADPVTWHDAQQVSSTSARIPEGPVRVSPSKVQSYSECALRWLLTSHGGDDVGALSSTVGTLIHDIVASDPQGSERALLQTLRQRWPELGAGESWVSTRAQARAEEMISRYAVYRSRARSDGRELVGVELPTTIDLGRARLTGQVDRLERAADGSVIVVDLKTGSSKPAAADVATHPQLAAYQVAVVEGGFTEQTGPDASSGGAALAHLGAAGVKSGLPQMQPPLSAAENSRWAHDLIETTADGMAGAHFPATKGSWCRSCVVRACCPLQPEGERQ